MQPEEAKRAVTSFVDRSTAALGGDWTVYSGPRLGICKQDDGREGVRYVYILERAAGDPATDIDIIDQLWQDQGMTTQRYQTGGDDPELGLRAAGGPVRSSDFAASVHGYTLSGTSKCSDGNYVTMVEETG